jgi:hypothetical protein
MKTTIRRILFNIALFIANEENYVSEYVLFDGTKWRRRNRIINICGIPFQKITWTEIV